MMRKIQVLLLLLLLTLGGCGRSGDSVEDYDQKIKKAQKALEKNYNNPKTHTYLGILYEKRGLTAQAEKHYRIAIELDPHFSEAITSLGNLYFKEKDFPASIQTLQMAVESNPNDPKVHYLIATVYKESRQYREASTHYQRALELDPNHLLAQNYLGVIYYELKEFEKAEEAFNRTLMLDPNFADAYGNLGILYDFNLHDRKKAVEYYEKFLELKSEGENVLVIQELLNKSKTELAKTTRVDQEQKKESENVDHFETPLAEAKMLLAQGKYEEAKTKLKAYISQKPEDLEAKTYWALVVSKTESNQRAIQVLRETLEKVKNSADLWYEIAYAYDREGSSEALNAFQQAVKLSPNDIRAPAAREKIQNLKLKAPSTTPVEVLPQNTINPKPPAQPVTITPAPAKDTKPLPKETPPAPAIKISQASKTQSTKHFNQGVIYQAKGQHTQAILEYEKAVQLNPYNVKAHYNLGILYKWKGDYGRAVRKYNDAIKLDPNFSKAYYNLGIILKAQGRREEALSKFKKAVQIDPRYSDAYLGLGLIYSQNRREIHQAVFNYKKYLQLNPTGPTASKIKIWLHSIGEDG
jgi:superkiller protein 3